MMTNIIITMNLSLSAHVMPLLNHADPVLPMTGLSPLKQNPQGSVLLSIVCFNSCSE